MKYHALEYIMVWQYYVVVTNDRKSKAFVLKCNEVVNNC